MKAILKSSSVVIIVLLSLVISGCSMRPQELIFPPPVTTTTPVQPVSNTATSLPAPTATTLPPIEVPTNPAIPTITAEFPTEEPGETAPATETITATQASVKVTVPILLYHHVSESIDTQYNVHPDQFAAQMQWLYDHGYTTVTIADVANAIKKGGELPARPVVLTFDDGYLDVYQNAYPILEQYDFIATFYIIANTVDTTGNLNTRKLQKLIASGWEIGSHSMTHANLTADSDWNYEIIDSRALLEDKLDTEIFTFAYPYGRVNDELKAYTRNAGYSAAVGLGSIMEHSDNTLYFLHRKEIKSWYDLDFFDEFMLWID